MSRRRCAGVALLAALLLAAPAPAAPAPAVPAPVIPMPAVPAPGDSAAAAVATPARAPAAPPPVLLPPISPMRAVLMTPVLPGWGQLYARSGWRAALAFGAETFYWSQLLKNDRKAVRYGTMEAAAPGDAVALRAFYAARGREYRERVRDFAWWSLGALLIIALDAYVDANLYGFDQDPVPVPDRWEDQAAASAAVIRDADFAVPLWRTTF